MRIVQTAFLVTGLCSGLVTILIVATGTAETALGILWHSIEPRSLNLLQALIHFYIRSMDPYSFTGIITARGGHSRDHLYRHNAYLVGPPTLVFPLRRQPLR